MTRPESELVEAAPELPFVYGGVRVAITELFEEVTSPKDVAELVELAK